MSLRHLYLDLSKLGCYPDVSMSDKCYGYKLYDVVDDNNVHYLTKKWRSSDESMKVIYDSCGNHCSFDFNKIRHDLHTDGIMYYLSYRGDRDIPFIEYDTNIFNTTFYEYILDHQKYIKTMDDLRKYILDYIKSIS